jgi:hypothetical protein
VRTSALFALLLACSTNTKHDDAKMTTPPIVPPQPAAATGAKVYLATPQGDVAVNVEVVSTQPKIERGLMYRENLPPEDGMLFLLGIEKDWTFWMRNTLIPLDMIFIKKDMTIAGIVENAEPKTETLRRVNAPSLYVLEVNAGWTAAHHVVAGAKVRYENVQ